jgi:hypothetical protein
MARATVDQLLTTTRTVRKRLDLSRPVEPAVIYEKLPEDKRKAIEQQDGAS